MISTNSVHERLHAINKVIRERCENVYCGASIWISENGVKVTFTDYFGSRPGKTRSVETGFHATEDAALDEFVLLFDGHYPEQDVLAKTLGLVAAE